MNTSANKLVVCLDDNYNWWLGDDPTEETSRDERRGILDPRQVTHLREQLTKYAEHGLRPEQFSRAFQTYALDSEINEGSLRLARVDDDIWDADSEVFAYPLLGGDGDGPYFDLLDALSAAHIRYVN